MSASIVKSSAVALRAGDVMSSRITTLAGPVDPNIPQAQPDLSTSNFLTISTQTASLCLAAQRHGGE